MAKWQCTNARVDGRPCGRVVETMGPVAPPAKICPDCKKPAKWSELKAGPPPLKRQGGQMPLNMGAVEREARKRRVAAIVAGLREPDLAQGVAGEILKFVKEVSSHEDRGWVGMVQDLGRVQIRLRLACRMFHNAEHLFRELSPRTSVELVTDLDEALKARWPEVAGGILGGRADFKIFALNPAELRQRARDGMTRTASLWPDLANEEEREKFIKLVFEHDKGYPQIRMALDDWQVGVRPERPAAHEGVHVGGAGGYDRRGGKKQAPTIAQHFNLLGEMKDAIAGKWVGRELYKAGTGKIKLVSFDAASKEYTYDFLGDKP